jgi:hypothetical protein
MRHRRFLNKKHRYEVETMNKYFDNQDESQLDELERAKYGQKVFEMANGIEVEFGKKKERGRWDKTRKKRKRDKMEENRGLRYTRHS